MYRGKEPGETTSLLSKDHSYSSYTNGVASPSSSSTSSHGIAESTSYNDVSYSSKIVKRNHHFYIPPKKNPGVIRFPHCKLARYVVVYLQDYYLNINLWLITFIYADNQRMWYGGFHWQSVIWRIEFEKTKSMNQQSQYTRRIIY